MKFGGLYGSLLVLIHLSYTIFWMALTVFCITLSNHLFTVDFEKMHQGKNGNMCSFTSLNVTQHYSFLTFAFYEIVSRTDSRSLDISIQSVAEYK